MKRVFILDGPDYLSKKKVKIKGGVTKITDWRRVFAWVDYVIYLTAYQDLLPNFSRFKNERGL
ncbi:hypothetical protein MUP65_00530 [Patescibacteria group bacterium]|nr:hypothetical protein [Patescibacteria group bacterium]